MRELLDPLSRPARILFLVVAGALAAFGAVIFVMGVLEGDGQTGLVILFFGIYVALAYGVIRGVDAVVGAIAARGPGRRRHP